MRGSRSSSVASVAVVCVAARTRASATAQRNNPRLVRMPSTRVFATYGAVSAAKAALESHTRQLALELASLGIAVNALRGGVTDTPALRKIPGNEKLVEIATQRNPHHRLTTPADLGGAIVALSRPEADWITGNVINVDGGEEVSA